MTDPLDFYASNAERGKEDAKGSSSDKKPPRRSLSRQRDLVEEIITAAQDAGAFDNLPGRGRPLRMKKNPYAPEWDLAHRLLKDNDLAPVWIMDRKELLARIDTLRRQIAAAWKHHRAVHADAQRRDQAVISWYDTCRRWEEEIEAINKDVADFNLRRPLDHLEILPLDLEVELERVKAPRWLR